VRVNEQFSCIVKTYLLQKNNVKLRKIFRLIVLGAVFCLCVQIAWDCLLSISLNIMRLKVIQKFQFSFPEIFAFLLVAGRTLSVRPAASLVLEIS
jgi:hypothetical protein